jgi:membrane protein implicated in regulation of membrane protease activity
MKNLFSSLMLIVVIFISPAIGVYFALQSFHPEIIFLSFFALSLILWFSLRKIFGWKIDEQTRKNHSW